MKHPPKSTEPHQTAPERPKAAPKAPRILRILFFLFMIGALALAYPLFSRDLEPEAIRFEQAPWLFGLLLLPVLLYRTTLGRDAREARLRMSRISALASVPSGLKVRLADLPGVMRTISLACFVLALARPLYLLAPETNEEEGIDLIVLLDLSGSMQAAMENLPEELKRLVGDLVDHRVPNRLDAAKAVLRDFIGHRKSDRIGVVVFGRSAYIVSPPTLDYELLDTLVSRMRLNLIDPNGTAIGDALGTAAARLRRSSAKSKAVILITDGDNKGGKVSPEYAAQLVSSVGGQIYPIQIGEGEAAKVERGVDLFGQPRFESVLYPTNPALLRSLAEKTGGEMQLASHARSLQKSLHQVLDRLEKTQFESASQSYEELFHYFLLPGVVLLLCEALLAVTWLRRFP